MTIQLFNIKRGIHQPNAESPGDFNEILQNLDRQLSRVRNAFYEVEVLFAIDFEQGVVVSAKEVEATADDGLDFHLQFGRRLRRRELNDGKPKTSVKELSLAKKRSCFIPFEFFCLNCIS
jgi:hypothetical protein